MDQQITDFLGSLTAAFVLFLPVLFGAVEFIKSKSGLRGAAVEWASAGLFVLYAVLIVVGYFFPSWGTYLAGAFLFVLMAALAPSGFYKFITARSQKVDDPE